MSTVLPSRLMEYSSSLLMKVGQSYCTFIFFFFPSLSLSLSLSLVYTDGRAVLVNLYKKVVLHHFNFKKPVYDIKYSPNGR